MAPIPQSDRTGGLGSSVCPQKAVLGQAEEAPWWVDQVDFLEKGYTSKEDGAEV